MRKRGPVISNLGISNYSAQCLFLFLGGGYENKSIAVCAAILGYVSKHHKSAHEEINSVFSADLLCNKNG